MHPAFELLLQDLERAVGPDAAHSLLDVRGLDPNLDLAHVTFGAGHAQVEPGHEAVLTASLVQKTLFDAVIDPDAPAWFLWTEERYEGPVSPYRDDPPERPTIWEEPGLFPPGARALAAESVVSHLDRLTEDKTVFRQWTLRAPPRVIGIDALLRASARSVYGSSDVPGPRLWARMLVLQAGGRVVFQNHVRNGACRLIARDGALLAPLLPPLRGWVQEASSDLAEPVGAAPSVSSTGPPPHTAGTPLPDLAWELWYQDLFDRDTPRSVVERGRGLVEGLTALWGRHLLTVPGRLTRYNLFGSLGSLEIEGDEAAQERLRTFVYGPQRLLLRGYREEADLPLLRKVALAHALGIEEPHRVEQMLALVAESIDRFEFERRLDRLIRSSLPENASDA